MNITFLGATRNVTGSKYLITTINNHRILVDCGLFQGLKELRLRNWAPLPYQPSQLDAVILTHAHIDHSGYIPLLVKNGYKGKIYCSEATKDLCSILLPDSGHLQEEEARYANLHGYSKHKPALPLYTYEDAERSLEQFHAVDFRVPFRIKEVECTLFPAGHILGASFVEIKEENTKLLFSGDIGRQHDLIMNPPSIMQSADYLVLESTYGDRIHEKTEPLDQLSHVINRTAKRGGTLVVAAFAVGRAQTLLYLIYQLKKKGKIPNIPVFMDSPMATDATKIFYQYGKYHRLDQDTVAEVCEVATYTHTPEESEMLDTHVYPTIIISASGMATGGRILFHLRKFAPDPRNTLLFTGYQAAGTRGESIVNGKQEVKMLGQMVPIRAEVVNMTNLSAHADYPEILEWLTHFNHPPKKIFITHGETNAAEALKQRIEAKFGWRCIIPDYLQTERL